MNESILQVFMSIHVRIVRIYEFGETYRLLRWRWTWSELSNLYSVSNHVEAVSWVVEDERASCRQGKVGFHSNSQSHPSHFHSFRFREQTAKISIPLVHRFIQQSLKPNVFFFSSKWENEWSDIIVLPMTIDLLFESKSFLWATNVEIWPFFSSLLLEKKKRNQHLEQLYSIYLDTLIVFLSHVSRRENEIGLA